MSELKKLDIQQACGFCLMRDGSWVGPAHWLVNGTSMCDACIRQMADMNSDNETFLQPALADIKAREESKDADAPGSA